MAHRMHLRIALATVASMVAWTLAAGTARASEDDTARVTLEYLVSGGDVYGPLVNDGEERAGSFGARVTYDVRGWRIAADYRRSTFTTENTGPGSFTRFPAPGGGYAQVPFFNAAYATSALRLERRLGRRGWYGGITYALATGDDPFPRLAGPGFIVERAPDRGSGIKGYASIAYAYVAGTSGGTRARFGLAKGDAGIAYAIAPRLALLAGYANEIRQPAGLPGRFLLDRSLPYFGLALRP